jgi:leucyl-tRNA synthetase
VTEDLSDLRFNTSVSQLMIFVNHLTKLEKLDKSVLHQFLLILNPFAPHLSEELNEMLGFETLVNIPWPEYDELKIIEEKITIAVQFNGKTRGKISITSDVNESMVKTTVQNDENLNKYLIDKEIVKTIYIKDRIVNFVIK